MLIKITNMTLRRIFYVFAVHVHGVCISVITLFTFSSHFVILRRNVQLTGVQLQQETVVLCCRVIQRFEKGTHVWRLQSCNGGDLDSQPVFFSYSLSLSVNIL